MIDGADAGTFGGLISRFSTEVDNTANSVETAGSGDALDPGTALKIQYEITKYETQVKFTAAFIGALRSMDSFAIEKIQ